MTFAGSGKLSITLGLNARTLPANSFSPSAKILTQAASTGRRTRKFSLVSASEIVLSVDPVEEA